MTLWGYVWMTWQGRQRPGAPAVGSRRSQQKRGLALVPCGNLLAVCVSLSQKTTPLPSPLPLNPLRSPPNFGNSGPVY